MLIRVVTVGVRAPDWVNRAVRDYSERLPADFGLEWKEVRPEPRTANAGADTWMQREAHRIRASLPERAWIVALDERGRDLDTPKFAQRLEHWRRDGRPVAILIGGADGLAPDLKAEAGELMRLSSLTLPHMLVRVVLAEQLFRAWSLLNNHPYHRA